ncbi:MAG: TRAP transporter substrate-binding protein DctP [Alphaproteobacteria bacterium]|nr:TRAP transporter substrate-binding protein DctP [Alphaproteobacteria bacterium]
MKLRILAALIAFATACGVTAATAQTLKLGTLAPKGSPWFDILQDMTAEWSAASGGGIKARIYPGGSIGDENDMIRKMRIGQLQGAVLTSEGLGRIVPEIRVLQLPMWYRSDEELDYVRAGLNADIEALFEQRGFKVLNWGDIGWVRLFTTSPAPSPASLQSLKLFCWAGDPRFCDAWTQQGYISVPLAFTDIFSGLQSGMIDALFTAPVPALSYQWFGIADQMTDVKMIKMIGATIVTMKVWNKIPADVRARVLTAAAEAGSLSEARIRGFEEQSIKVMQEYGLTVHPLSPALQEAWEIRSRDSYPALVDGIVPPDLFAKARRLREDYRSRRAGIN